MSSEEKDLPSLSKIESVILDLLVSHDELYGLEMIAKSHNTLKRGTIYVTLDRLEDKGFVSSKEVKPPAGAQGPSRRAYRITGLGNRVLEARNAFAAIWRGTASLEGTQ
jgi:DNA-binding PadR family transcriptional regulator